jgi:hypothetical protein
MELKIQGHTLDMSGESCGYENETSGPIKVSILS